MFYHICKPSSSVSLQMFSDCTKGVLLELEIKCVHVNCLCMLDCGKCLAQHGHSRL